jgi:membrane protease subunit (stomatin/prohibitin family)
VGLFSREFIAVPDNRKGQIVFKWPDVSIRKFTRAIVEPDEIALFVNQGQVIGQIGPGKHQIDANELPFLGAFIDTLSGGKAYRAELYFVGTREYTGQAFGGRIDDVQDPQTGMIITLRVFGDYSMRVVDPAKLILNLTGTVDVTDNEKITDWIAEQLLKVMRTSVTTEIVRNGWPILGLSAYTPDIEKAVIDAGNGQLDTYGLAIVRMGNFDVNLSDEDEAQLKGLAKDTAYSRLAGSFQQYASGEMMKGAGEGMAKGGGAVGGAFIAAGMGMGGQAAAPYAPGPTPPAGPGFVGGGGGFAQPGGTGAVTCPSCHTANAPGAKFCASCGTSLAPPAVECPSCHAENASGARFCASCGSALAAGPAHCAACGSELAEGAKFCPSCGQAVAPAAATAAAGSEPAASASPEPPAGA